MAYELLGNLGESTLNGTINNSVTTLTVTSAAAFPAAVTGTSQFRVIVGTEIMIVTNVSGTTFTVTRGAESTTAASHSSGDAITHVITAGTLQAIFGGGTAGQVLAKTASADYALVYKYPPHGVATFSYSGTMAVTTGKGRFRMPVAATIIGVSAAVNTAPTGASIKVDVNKNGTTVYTTQGNRPDIAVSTNAAAETVPDVTALAVGDYLSVDIDQIGSTVPGSDLVVQVRYRETLS